MNARLLFGHPALRTAPAWCLMNGTFVLLGVALTDAMASRSPDAFIVVTWSALPIFFLTTQARARAGELDLALPLTGRTLWLRHVAAVAGTVLAMVATAWLLLPAVSYRGQSGPDGLHLAGLRLAAGGLLATALIEAVDVRRALVPLRSGPALWRFLVAFVLGQIVPWVARDAVSGVLVPLLLAAGVVFWSARRVPASLDTAALDERRAARAGRGSREAQASREGRVPGARVLLLKLLFGYAPRWGQAFWPAMMAILGWGAAGGLEFLFRSSSWFYTYIAAQSLFAVIPSIMRPLRFVDPLPVPRARLLAAMLAPLALAFLAGVAVALVTSDAPLARVLPVTAGVVVAWLLAVALYLRAYRAGVPGWARHTVYWVPSVVFLALPIAALLFRAGGVAFSREDALMAQVARLTGSPAGALLAAVMLAAALAAAWRLAVVQFARMEIPLQPDRYELGSPIREDA